MTRKIMYGLDLNAQRIESLGPPEDDDDAATKRYVDTTTQVVAADLDQHVVSTTPHPEYDDGVDFVLLYMNAKV